MKKRKEFKIKFSAEKIDIGESLGVSEKRLAQVFSNTIEYMRTHNPNGLAIEMLEHLIEQCTSTNEVVMVTLKWDQWVKDIKMRRMAEESKKPQIIKP